MQELYGTMLLRSAALPVHTKVSTNPKTSRIMAFLIYSDECIVHNEQVMTEGTICSSYPFWIYFLRNTLVVDP